MSSTHPRVHDRRTDQRFALALLAMVALVVSLVGATPVEASPEQDLEQTRERLDGIRSEIDKVEERVEQDRARLAEAERQLAAVMEAVAEAERAVAAQREEVERARRRLAELEEEERRHQQVMARRAATLYQQGTATPWSAVLASGSVDEVVERSTFVEIVSRADLAGFQELEISQVAIEAQRERLVAEEAMLTRVLEQQEAILADVRELRNERALVFAGSRDKLADLEAEENHLESERRELRALARRASQERAARSQSASIPSGPSASGWVWPASGRVTSEYGMRWGRMHEGIDVGGATGAPVVAARGGTISHAGRMGGYGNLILVSHGGGFTSAYAHLSAFAVSSGQSVERGQRIGSIGCTGSCSGSHLHFEIRVNGASRNPRQFLP